MRALIKLFLLLVLLVLLTIPAVLWFGLADAPLVTQKVRLSHQDIARAQAVLKRYDPRNLPAGAQPTVVVSHRDLDLAANYLLQTLAKGGAEFRLANDRLDLTVSLQIPHLPRRNIVNIEGTLETGDGRPQITQLRLGRVPVPGAIATLVTRHLLAQVFSNDESGQGGDPIRQLRAFPDHLQVTYRWHPALIDQARDTLLSGSDREALRFYHDRLVELQDQGIGKTDIDRENQVGGRVLAFRLDTGDETLVQKQDVGLDTCFFRKLVEQGLDELRLPIGVNIDLASSWSRR